MQLQEEATGVAQDGARFVASPQRRSARGAVLADRLVMASQQAFKCVLLRKQVCSQPMCHQTVWRWADFGC